MSLPSYTVVIATRNRADSLKVSLKFIRAQTVAPTRVVIVDSSDDPERIRPVVEVSLAGAPFEWEFHRSAPGLTKQRNLGLSRVETPIAFFPDDDSILYPGCAEEILKVYAADTDEEISAVAAIEAHAPPEGFPSEEGKPYDPLAGFNPPGKLNTWRQRLGERLVLDPLNKHSRHRFPATIGFLQERRIEAEPVEWMEGFRMTFRVSGKHRPQFDEAFEGYCIFEDRDASLAAWRTGVVVAAKKARIYHFRAPGARADGYRMGVTQLLNYVYIGAKHTTAGHPSRRFLRRHVSYRLLTYFLGAGNTYNRQRWWGAFRASREVKHLLAAPPEGLSQLYREAIKKLLAKGGRNRS